MKIPFDLIFKRRHMDLFFSKKKVFIVLIKFLAALTLPGALVVLFTRVAYNHVLGLVLTVALIAASVYKGYTDSWLLIVVDALSLTAGFAIARKMTVQARKRA